MVFYMDALAAQIVWKLLLDCTGEQELFCSLRCSTDGAVGVVSYSNLFYRPVFVMMCPDEGG